MADGGIGERLREARLARGIELGEVERRTKIRIRYLRAIETDDWHELPGAAYARGFLRAYAQLLGLDADALVDEYRRRHEPPEEEYPPLEPALDRPRPRRGPGAMRGPGAGPGTAVALAVVAVLAILLVLGLTGGDDEGPRDRDRRGDRPAAGRTTTRPEPPPEPAQVSVRLRPTGPVWVCLVDQSGRRLVNGETLSPGDERGPFEARELELTLGNGQIELQLDGEPLRVPDAAEPLGFRLDPRGVHDLGAARRPTCA